MKTYDKWESEMIELLESGVKLTVRQLRNLQEYSIEKITGENRRWSRSITDICHVGEKYYELNWEEGLTENQENDFGYQPVEVELHEEEVTFIKRTWKKVKK